MSLSFDTQTYAGGVQTFPVSFALGYGDRTNVHVYVVGELDGAGDQLYRDFTWNSDSEILVTDALTVGDSVRIQRTVSKTTLVADYTQPGSATRQNLQATATQAMMAIHEFIDGRVDSLPSDHPSFIALAAAEAAAADAVDSAAAVAIDAAAAAASADIAAAAAAATVPSVDTAVAAAATAVASAEAAAAAIGGSASNAEAAAASAVSAAASADAAAASASGISDIADDAAASAADAAASATLIGSAMQGGNNLSEIVNTATALATLGGAAKSANLSDIPDKAAARSNLGLSSGATTTVSSFGASLVDDTTAAAARTTLGLGAGALVDFTPVQQGGGAGQLTNKVYLGWDGTRLRLQVDSTDFGQLARTADIPNVASATASLGVGEVGTYALLTHYYGTDRGPGDYVSGSRLKYVNLAENASASAIVGTWKCMGNAPSGAYSRVSTSVWLRIA